MLPDSNGIVETDPRYAAPQKKKFSTRSEGNRFVKNKDLWRIKCFRRHLLFKCKIKSKMK